LYLNENIALTDLAVLFCMLVIGSFYASVCDVGSLICMVCFDALSPKLSVLKFCRRSIW